MTLLIPAVFGCMIYIALLFILKTEEAQDVMTILRKKGKKVA